MKQIFKLLFIISASFLLLSACNKIAKNEKHFSSDEWEAEEVIFYEYSAGGQNLGVGVTDFEWAVIDMDFTNTRKRNGGVGRSAFMTVRTPDGNESTFEVGRWEYGQNEEDYPYAEGSGYKDYPAELKEAKTVIQVEGGTIRLFIIDINKKKMDVIFQHTVTGAIQGVANANQTYWSPVIPFKRKRK